VPSDEGGVQVCGAVDVRLRGRGHAH